VCTDGKCVLVEADCDDLNVCTADSCDASKGCQHAPANGTPCDDGLGCTKDDKCLASQCKAGASDCDDSNLCTDDACTAKGCTHLDNTLACNDNLACTGADACSGGACVGVVKVCADSDPCTNDSCVAATGACQSVAKNCSDGDNCTTDTCDVKTGSCSKVGIIGCGGYCAKDADCDDKKPCTKDSCPAVGGKCLFANDNTLTCEDGLVCTVNGCQGGTCTVKEKDCDDKESIQPLAGLGAARQKPQARQVHAKRQVFNRTVGHGTHF